jgi:septum formation protein
MMRKMVLASASPRRKLLLEQAGVAFEVDPSDVPEPEPTGPVDPAEYAAELAWRKARAVAKRRGSGLVLGADTVCEVDGTVLNKPIDRDDAERMLRLQEGRDTRVLTAICLYDADRDEWLGAVETSVVRCRVLGDDERAAYLGSGQWRGKAGGYGLQDEDPFVTIASGSWSNVVGLPVERLIVLLQHFPRPGHVPGDHARDEEPGPS